MKRVLGLEGWRTTSWTQKPISGRGAGRESLRRPLLIGLKVLPPSSERNAPAAEMAMVMRLGLEGSSKIVCRHRPPAPGDHFSPLAPRRAEISCHVAPPLVVLNSAASSTPA